MKNEILNIINNVNEKDFEEEFLKNRYEMIYSTYKDILNDLNFNIVEEEDLVSVFYNGEQVDACEIIREEI